MIVKKLDTVDFETIMQCFLKAFDNYFVKMPTEYDYYKKRWKAAKVRFDLSYGMFDNEKLVGFIINGIDLRNGDLVAFNTGTGVIPEYRGLKIVRSIYDYALVDLKKNGITKCSLEVIKENKIAIRAYQSIGFEICKNYKCFKGEVHIDKHDDIELKEVDFNNVDWVKLPNQKIYSWDNDQTSLKEGEYRFFYVLKDNTHQSFFVLNQAKDLLAQFEILERSERSWNNLFYGIMSISKSLRINNVDESLKEKIDILTEIGFSNSIDQYEMELKI
jgi:ribosomal protein S18 acetylase RimI-like enzyme